MYETATQASKAILNSPLTATPCRHVDIQLNDLHRKNEAVIKLLGELELRLAPVTRQNAPDLESGNKEPQEWVVPVASEIRSAAKNAELAVSLITSIINRLEV